MSPGGRRDVESLWQLVLHQSRLIEAAYQSVVPLRHQLEWAAEFFPDFLARLAVVERALATTSPPHKPWLPKTPPFVEDKLLAAQRFRESLDPTLVARMDAIESQWPYCAWHLVHARMRGAGNPVSLALDPRDKLVLDRAWEVALEAAFFSEERAGDLFFHWCELFFASDIDELEGNSLADKFLRVFEMFPKRLPPSLVEDWPNETTVHMPHYQPVWPMAEVEFQWVQLRKHHYQERSRRLAEQEEAKRQHEAQAELARKAVEDELREQHHREKAQIEQGWRRGEQ